MKHRFGRSNGSSQYSSLALACFSGHGLAGKGRLVDEQVLGFEEAQVPGYHIAGGEAHDIARHELCHGDFRERIIRKR
jgi:hypothetical protein